jgi:two-component system, OmpR family, response regulator
MRVLIVEDEQQLADAVARGLRREGMAVDVAYDGDTGHEKSVVTRYDVVVLDRDLPGMSGDRLCAEIVASGATTRVLMLTASGTLADKVDGLSRGADDYLAKPFDLPVLEARVRALLRRGTQSTPFLEHGLLRFDTVGRRVFYDKRPLELSPRELAVLELLLMREGRVVSKEQMVNHLYGWGDEVGDNAIEVYVYRLRKKLEPLGCEIRTVRGMGYLMERGDAAD